MKKPEARIRPWLYSQAAMGIMVLPWLWMLNQNKAKVGSEIAIPSIGRVIDGIGTAPVSFIKGYAGRYSGWETVLSLSSQDKILILIGVIVAIVLAIAARRFETRTYRRNLITLAIFSILTISYPVLVHLASGSQIAGRYYAVAAPIFFLLTAALFNSLPSKTVWLPGGILVILLLSFLNIQRRESFKDDWLGIMNTISFDYEKGDEILCFPIHHCSTAKYYYLGSSEIVLPIKGGAIAIDEEQATYLFPPDFTWTGYKTIYPDSVPIIDPDELKQSLSVTIPDAERVWLISGTGNLGNYPEAENVEGALQGEWDLEQVWNFSPISLKLYVHK
jgi:hypothetical protein